MPWSLLACATSVIKKVSDLACFQTIRTASHDDIPYIMALEAMPENTYVHGYDAAKHHENLDKTDAHYFIAEDATGSRLGFAILFDDAHNQLEWRRIIVAEPGNGVGKAFMAAILAHFDAASQKTIWLDVYENNTRAQHVYRTLGFQEIRRKTYSGDPPGVLIIMERALRVDEKT